MERDDKRTERGIYEHAAIKKYHMEMWKRDEIDKGTIILVDFLVGTLPIDLAFSPLITLAKAHW